MSNNPTPINVSQVRNPKWTGKAGETAILVSRGEPNRTDIQMEQAVAEQMSNYLLHFTKVAVTPVLVAFTTQLIAKDYIIPPGTRLVALSREHLLKFIEVGQQRLADLEGSGA